MLLFRRVKPQNAIVLPPGSVGSESVKGDNVIYSTKQTLKRRNISRVERAKVKKLQASKQTQWMIADVIK